MLLLLGFLFGLSIGSFLSCLVYRLNHGLSVAQGWSFCDRCHRQLRWYDNLPLVSFLFLKGRCRYCHAPISWQYPLAELATGILTVLVINSQFSVFHLIIAYLLLAVFLSDLNYGTIPDQIVYPGMVLAIFFHLRGVPQAQHHLGGVLITALVAAGFFWLLVAITKGKGMGLGDVKLAGLMGLMLGWPKIVLALFMAFLTGALAGIVLILWGKKGLRSQIAFGPFLAAAAWIVLFWGEALWSKIAVLLY